MSLAPPSQSSRSDPIPLWESVQLPPHLAALLSSGKQHRLNQQISVFEGFGSFHSENVEDLIAMEESAYTPPANLPAFAKRLLSKSEMATIVSRSSKPCPAVDEGHEERASASLFTNGTHTSLNAAAHASRKRNRTAASTNSSNGSSSYMATGSAEEGNSPSRHASMKGGSTHPQKSDEDAVSGAGYAESEDHANASSDISSENDSDDAPRSNTAALLVPLSLGTAIATSAERQMTELARRPVSVCAMGQAFRQEHFSITEDMVFINHGAFGSSLSGAMLIKRLYEEHMEEEVVAFVDRELLPLIVYSIRSLGRFLHAKPQQVVLLQNATFALNCAMRLVDKDDVVAFLDTEYLAVYKMLWFRCEEVGAALHEISLNKFLHDDAVMGDDAALTAELCRQLPAGCTTVVLDYVTSTSALCFPVFSHIVPALRARGVTKIIVDGAHAPLQVELNFDALPTESQPTVFVGNLHKWFSSPKAAGFFWVRAEDMDRIHSVVLSHGAGEGLLSEFIWDGTRDYGAYLSIPAIVSFWEAQGMERVRAYASDLLRSAADMLTTAFHSRKVARHAPFMSLVELPETLQDEFITAKYIQDSLHDVYRVEVPVKRIESRYYLRISAFVYNTPAEYVYLREAVKSIAEKWMMSPERALLLQQQTATDSGAAASSAAAAVVPCSEKIRRQGGCGVSGLDPSLKRRKTKKFA